MTDDFDPTKRCSATLEVRPGRVIQCERIGGDICLLGHIGIAGEIPNRHYVRWNDDGTPADSQPVIRLSDPSIRRTEQ